MDPFEPLVIIYFELLIALSALHNCKTVGWVRGRAYDP